MRKVSANRTGTLSTGSWWIYLLLFAGLIPVLFLLSSRLVPVYDEGIALTGAMRVMAGQVPHRDFYFNYGAGSLLLYAGMFKIFGASVLVERITGLVASSGLIVSMYALARRVCTPAIAVAATVLCALWTMGDLIQGMGPAADSIAVLWSTWLILPVENPDAQRRRAFAAGLLVAALALLRYDLGIGIACAHVAAIALFLLLQYRTSGKSPRRFVEQMCMYPVGIAVIAVPALIAYLRVAPIHDVLYDIVLYPARYYHAARHMPWPRLQRTSLADCEVYVLPVLMLFALYPAVRKIWRRSEQTSSVAGWINLLVAFSMAAIVLYMKGSVRPGAGQMFTSTMPSIFLLAVLFQHRERFALPGRAVLWIAAFLLFIFGCAGVQAKLAFERQTSSSTLKWILAPAHQAPLPPYREWCDQKTPITTGFCFLLDNDHIRTMEYIEAHTRPGDTLYVGLTHHDRVFANDNILYFATQRLPATKWSHFDPFLQNRADIQQEMIGELGRNAPPYIVLDSEFEQMHEPNGSSVSTGVHLLDDYIASHYAVVQRYGELTILEKTGR